MNNDLLAKRFKVIAEDTTGFFKVGDIFMQMLPNNSVWRKIESGQWTDTTISNPEKYPHLFKELKWHEELTNEQMQTVKYVKDEYGVYKVKSWHRNLACLVTVFINPSIHKGYTTECKSCGLYPDFLPATKSDYNNYINQQLK